MTRTPPNPWKPGDADVLEVLREAAFQDLQVVYDSSNYVLLATLSHPERGHGLGIYKPARGERPLGDFPFGTLHHREVAAFEFSRLLGWDLVPPTVQRDGPHGEGSLQLFVEHDPEEHYFVLRDDDGLHEQLVRLAAFDLVANNADRKGGHVLKESIEGAMGNETARIWGIDNGLTFHPQEKLRTVIWDFAGVTLPGALLDDLRGAAEALAGGHERAAALQAHLTPREVATTIERIQRLVASPQLPEMYPWRCTPWPLI